jgi:hypothetical protein
MTRCLIVVAVTIHLLSVSVFRVRRRKRYIDAHLSAQRAAVLVAARRMRLAWELETTLKEEYHL